MWHCVLENYKYKITLLSRVYILISIPVQLFAHLLLSANLGYTNGIIIIIIIIMSLSCTICDILRINFTSFKNCNKSDFNEFLKQPTNFIILYLILF